MGTRLVALVATTDLHPESRHKIGFPREIGGSKPERMPWPRALVIEEQADGVTLDRYALDGSPAGDTWHMSIEEAKEQAQDEYDGLLSDWRSVPAEIGREGLLAFALAG